MPETADIAIIGAGAAGLMAGIWAGRALKARMIDQAIDQGLGRCPQMVILDSAKHVGAKILVAGGGRCNVTHDVVDEQAFAGSSRHAIKKVLRRFDVPQTVEFFRERGVQLKREETGKLFPTTDQARTVLDALLHAAGEAGVEIRHPWRVESVQKTGLGTFVLTGASEVLHARSVILATGGRSLPKTGSDGHGYVMVRSLGHSITPRVFPALVPLTMPRDHVLCGLSGLSCVATLEVRNSKGKKIISFTDSTLCTHFGLSGPSVLDISRYFTQEKLDHSTLESAGGQKSVVPTRGAQLLINWLPGETVESADGQLLGLGKVSPGRWLRENGLPQRLAEALCVEAGVDPSSPAHQLTRENRRALAMTIAEMTLPITGDRGFTYAEVTAGGVPLSEIRLETMESRICPGLYLCGEICDVDGRIGGYNFQWAWSSGYVAGNAAAQGAFVAC